MLLCCAPVCPVLDTEPSCVQRWMLCFLASNTLLCLNTVLPCSRPVNLFVDYCLDCLTWSACILLLHHICIASIHLECMIFNCMFSLLFAFFKHWTPSSPASNTYNWLNLVFKRRFCFGRRFPHFIASDTCFHPCMLPDPCFGFAPCIARFPVVFHVGFLSPLYVVLLHHVVFT